MARTSLVVVILTLAVSACRNDAQQTEPASSPQARESSAQARMPPGRGPGPGHGAGMHGMTGACPMAVADVSVDVADTKDGVALTFTTREGDVADLRGRVQQMATMYEVHRGRGRMMWHPMGQGRGRGQGMQARGMLPAVAANVIEIENGARLELTPRDPAQLDLLREHMRAHQQRMQSGECWMLQEPQTGSNSAAPAP